MRWLSRSVMTAFMMLVLVGAAHALIIDDAGMVAPELQQQIDNFNANSAVQLSVITANASYDVAQQAAENFNTYKLKLLLFYSKADDRAVIVQPTTAGIPQASVAALLDQYHGEHGKNFAIIVAGIMQRMGQWQENMHGPTPICSLLKDGKCDRNCKGTDLDCLCGNRVCESFESSDTCPQDCKSQSIWCGIQPDGKCDQTCAIPDIDCPVKPGMVSEQQRTAFTLWAVLGGSLLVLLAIFSAMHEYRKMHRKGGLNLSSGMLGWILKIGAVIIALFFVLFFVQNFLSLNSDTKALRGEIFLQRVLNSPTGIAYVDANGVTWPGTIEAAKFSSQQLEASMVPATQDWIAAELDLDYLGKPAGMQPIHFNGEQYAQWQRQVALGQSVSVQREVFVLVHDLSGIHKGKLRVSMITPEG